MEFFTKDLKSIVEVKYLNAENVRRYRAIIKVFYQKYQQYIYFLYKEDIFMELTKSNVFEEYKIEMCEQDINQLMEWKNLIGIQDTAKGYAMGVSLNQL